MRPYSHSYSDAFVAQFDSLCKQALKNRSRNLRRSLYRRIKKEVLEHLAPIMSAGFVIGGNAPITQTAFNKAMERIGRTIDLHGATAHVFRHSYATMLDAAGASPKTIQQLIGHADISTTMNRYVHGDKGQEVEAVMNVSMKLAEAV